MFLIRFGLLLTVIALLAGCKGSGPKIVPVQGKVALDGAPMPSGQVVLEGADGSAPVTLEVKDGAFTGKASVGKKTVRISSFKKGGQKATGPGGGEEVLTNIIPAKYNTESTQTVEVQENAPNNYDFKVTSK